MSKITEFFKSDDGFQYRLEFIEYDEILSSSILNIFRTDINVGYCLHIKNEKILWLLDSLNYYPDDTIQAAESFVKRILNLKVFL